MCESAFGIGAYESGTALKAFKLDKLQGDAVFLTGAVWLANQFVGYTILRYP
jgi:hypothetical protein